MIYDLIGGLGWAAECRFPRNAAGIAGADAWQECCLLTLQGLLPRKEALTPATTSLSGIT